MFEPHLKDFDFQNHLARLIKLLLHHDFESFL